MPTSIVAAIVAGVFGLITAIISAFIAAYTASNRTNNEMKVNQAVTNEKIDNLRDEVREYGIYAKRVPVLEEQIKNLNARLKTVEEKVKKDD